MSHVENFKRTSFNIGMAVTLWGAVITYLAMQGVLVSLSKRQLALVLLTTLVVPSMIYFKSISFKEWARKMGIKTLTAFHVLRMPAALFFFYYGLKGELPTIFWMVAGIGDFIAGAIALFVVTRPKATMAQYKFFHTFGLIDFICAVGTGLTFSLILANPLMDTIAVLPVAWIPFFGVGLSGTIHIIAFNMMRTGAAKISR